MRSHYQAARLGLMRLHKKVQRVMGEYRMDREGVEEHHRGVRV